MSGQFRMPLHREQPGMRCEFAALDRAVRGLRDRDQVLPRVADSLMMPGRGGELLFAQDARQSELILKGEIITAEGNYDAQGVLHAKTIVRAKASPALWPRDQ